MLHRRQFLSFSAAALSPLFSPLIARANAAPHETIVGLGSSTLNMMRRALTAEAEELDFKYFNEAVSGGLSPHVLTRIGALPIRLEAGRLPARKAAAIFSPDLKPHRLIANFPAEIAGVKGEVSSSTLALTFQRENAGDVVEYAEGTLVVPRRPVDFSTAPLIVNIGKNDINRGATATDVIQNYEALIAMRGSLERMLVLGLFVDTNISADDRRSVEVAATNAALASVFGSAFIDLDQYLLSEQIWADTGISPGDTDLAAQAAGKKAPALSRYLDGYPDPQHLSGAVSRVVVDRLIAPRMRDAFG